MARDHGTFRNTPVNSELRHGALKGLQHEMSLERDEPWDTQSATLGI